ncbi:MAG: MobF family relaxase [Acetobacteraceae bacterium]
MSGHLLSQTLPAAVADIARYYSRGGGPVSDEDREIEQLAHEILDGDLTFEDAVADLMLSDMERGGDGGIERRDYLSDRLSEAALRIDLGELDASVAQLRPDLHPAVAQGLGIDPTKGLRIDQLNALLGGRRADGEKIEGKRYASAHTYTDARTGEVKERIPLGSVDFTLTPDKSVSLAWAFGQPAEQAAIYTAHRDAAHEAMLYITERVGVARTGASASEGYEPGHVGWVAFDHYTARPTLWMARDENGERITEAVSVKVAGDPDLHTHFTVFNAVFTDSGRVGALTIDKLDGLVKEAGAYYQAHLATRLRALGADVMLDPDTGMARLTVIPSNVRDHFSKKTRNGEEAARQFAKEQGLDWDSLSEERRVKLLKAGTQATIKTDDEALNEKLKKDDLADFDSWRKQADDLGWKHETILTYGPPPPPLTPEQRMDRVQETAEPWLEKELDKRAVISEPDVRTAALRGFIAQGIDHSGDIDEMVRRFMRDGVRQQGERTALISEDAPDDRRHARYTTVLHEAQEREFIALAQKAAADRGGALGRLQIAMAIERSDLTFEGEHGKAQRDAIYRLGRGGKLGVFLASAGAGKTAALTPLVAAWNDRQNLVHGIALSWRQADELKDAGIKSVKAFSVFMDAAAKGEIGLSRNAVVVVDEISLLGTKQSLDLLRLQERHGFRLVMLGDQRQLQSIEAGPQIELLRKALGDEAIPQIESTVRQQTPREREIAGLMRQGRVDAFDRALTMKREDGTAELVPGAYDDTVRRVAEMVKERLTANAGDAKYTLTVSTPTNADAHKLGVAIREVRRGMGQIAADTVRIKAADREGNPYDMALAPGDRVRLFHSVRADGERGSIGRNQSVVTVLAADAKGMRVRNHKGRIGTVSWTTLANEQGHIRLAYGEVLTTHSAQGSTATEHIYALPSGSQAVNGFAAYSSGTRHRRKSFFVISEAAEKRDVMRSRPLNDTRPISRDDAWYNVARNLGKQPEKDTALAFLESAVNVKRGAARAFQRGSIPAQAREAKHQPPSVLEQRLLRWREGKAIAPVVAEVARVAKERGAVIERMAAVGRKLEQGVRQVRDRLTPRQERGRGPSIGI